MTREPRRLQPSFRLALSATLVGLVTIAVLATGLVSLALGRESATNLSEQVVGQTLHRIDLRIASFLRVAVRQSGLSRRLLEDGLVTGEAAGEAGPLTSEDFPHLTRHFTQAMQVHTGLTNLGLGLEATGEFCMVARKAGELTSVDYIREADGSVRVERFATTATSRRSLGPKPYDGYDPRRRPFYRSVLEADGPAWTEAYLFFGAGGRDRVPGVTYGSPVRAADGALVGVMHADFDLLALCRFLDELREEVPGFAFVVELRADGSRRTIAHPDPTTLLHRQVGPDGKEIQTLAEEGEGEGDPRVGTFLSELRKRAGEVGAESHTTATLRHQGEEYLGGYLSIEGPDAPRWAVCMMIPRSTIMEAVERNNRATIYIGLAALLAAILLSLLVAWRIATPLVDIATQSEAIGRFELDAPSLGRSTVVELDRLMVATDEMKASLRSFEHYVPARLVREMFLAGAEAELGGESRTLTVLFSHVVDFASLQARMSTERLVAHLGEFFAAAGEEVEATEGTLDKYMGDAVMAFWGAPHAIEDHALSASRAALRTTRRLTNLRERWAAEGLPAIRAGVGLNTGELVVGNMGSRSRLNYTVIGDAVNVAARLEGLNKVYGTEILMGEQTRELVADQVVARRIDRVAVKGKSQGVDVYELLALKEEASQEPLQLVEAYAAAFDLYLDRRFADAEAAFLGVLAKRPDDGPSRVLLERCREYREEEPGPDWNGVHVMRRK